MGLATQNSFGGLKIENDDRKRTLFLHYADESVYDSYDAEKLATEASYVATNQVTRISSLVSGMSLQSITVGKSIYIRPSIGSTTYPLLGGLASRLFLHRKIKYNAEELNLCSVHRITLNGLEYDYFDRSLKHKDERISQVRLSCKPLQVPPLNRIYQKILPNKLQYTSFVHF
ncbi:unnamed protein product [Mytilus coruscus]|uniref:Uncharacterized protein n=1 Tax=Mytilus coruscus TaxID=42192 RepID=A0A6J8BRU5_MYTCO|nr:unnamed protein product [Mytilus coruscus]